MPVLPNVLERFLARRGAIPPLLLDLGVPLFQVGVMMAALELRIFEHLDDDARDLEELAAATGCAERGLPGAGGGRPRGAPPPRPRDTGPGPHSRRSVGYRPASPRARRIP